MGRRLIDENEKMHKTGLEYIHDFYRHILDVSISIYMLVITVVIPFYHTNGYFGIATGKEQVYMWIAKILLILIAVEIILVWMIFLSKRQSKKESIRYFWNKISVTEKCTFCFGMVVFLSFLFTNYQSYALWGAEGWHMGFLTQMALLGSYYLIVHIWQKRSWILFTIFPASGLLFLTGYLNRFGIYPVEMPGKNPQFISFIGNINWYCGYMVTVLFAAVFLVWSGVVDKLWKKVLLYGYLVIGFASLVTQGSSSGILTLAAVLILLFYLSVYDAEKMYLLGGIAVLLALACSFTWIIRKIAPEAITYREMTTELLTNTPFPILLMIVSCMVFLWLSKMNREKKYTKRAAFILTIIFTVILIGLALGGVVVIISQFSPQWGSKRGATWMGGLSCFLEQSMWKKLIGIGPDCMGIYLSTDGSSEIKRMLQEQFGTLVLTNAHNEWLTMLADYGILGCISYIGMMVSAIVRYLKIGINKKHKNAWIVGACGLGIFAYSLHNMVSFQQVINTTTMYILLGVAEVYTKQEKIV